MSKEKTREALSHIKGCNVLIDARTDRILVFIFTDEVETISDLEKRLGKLRIYQGKRPLKVDIKIDDGRFDGWGDFESCIGKGISIEGDFVPMEQYFVQEQKPLMM